MTWFIVYCFVCAVIGCVMLASEKSQLTGGDIFWSTVVGWLIVPVGLSLRFMAKINKMVVWEKK